MCDLPSVWLCLCLLSSGPVLSSVALTLGSSTPSPALLTQLYTESQINQELGGCGLGDSEKMLLLTVIHSA